MNNYRTIQQKDMHKLFPAWEKNIPTLGNKCSHTGNKTALRFALSLLLMFMLGINTAWADDYSGVYYIANDNSASGSDDGTKYSEATSDAQKYYLVPAANPLQTNFIDAYYSPNHSTTNGDPEKPFLTTYHTNKDLNSIWIVKKTDNYYYVIHAITGKYVIYEVPLPNDPDKNNDSDQTKNGKRKTMHLQTPDDEEGEGTYRLSTNNNFQFNITLGSNIYRLQPRNRSGWYWNPANGNKNKYYGQTETIYQSGLIGVFNNSNDGGSKWRFEAAKLPAPTIEYDSENNKFTISYIGVIPEGFKILYTVDGSDPAPTIGGSTMEYTNESVITLATIEDHPLKAVVVRYGMILSETASLGKPANPSITHTPGDCNNTVTITADEGTNIYYTIDGTDPTNSSTHYTGPFVLNSDATIKAVAYNSNLHSDITTYNYSPNYSSKPTITQNGATITISGTGTIYYTTNGSDPDTGSTQYNAPFTLSENNGDVITVKAVAKDGSKGLSCVVEKTVTMGYFISNLTDLQGISSHLSDLCILTADFDASNLSASISGFTGVFDGGYYTISGLKKPLFDNLNGATVKNVILKNVKIEQSGNVGAIAGEASGYTRIYNCGILPSSNKYEDEVSYVKSTTTSGENTGYCGGLVGWLKDDSRVINCFSYANITGGTTVAGIVGYNNFASTAEESDGKYTKLKTAVVNCMFYGDITGGAPRYPVYGGEKILNNTATGINNYDFYRAEANLGLADNSHYNCSWPAQEEYLTKYEYYRYLLNSNRELCGWWVGAPSAPSEMTTTDVQAVAKDASLMAKWVLDPGIAPYPILKPAGKYYSVINQDPNNRVNPVSKAWESRTTSSNTIMTKAAPDTEGQKLGSVTVTINKGGGLIGSDSKVIPITAMDIENNDFCYGKIQLPYYNSIFGDPNSNDWTTRYGGNYKDKVVVGWEITSVTGGTPGTLAKHWQDGYNFADRDCTNKDKERIFAQGGYYFVPNGVSAITITAKWADAIYLDNSADHSYDRVYMSSNTDPNKNIGFHFAPAGYRPTSLGNNKTVQTASVSNQIPNGSVYEAAIVLVGNHQYRTGATDLGAAAKGCTIISADFDLDDEPDYSLIWQLGQGTGRQKICPIRFDFLPVVEMGMAMKEDASTQYYSLGCYLPLGHFEVTETSLIHFGQFEFGNKDRTKDAPFILNGGIFDQYCKGTRAHTDADDHIDYVILGGNVYMPLFSPGAHVNGDANYSTRHCAVNVLGGRINNLYLTGNFNNNVTPNVDNPHCYIDGGNFKQVAAAGKEGINGDVYFKINHSVIEEFYGGSTLADKLVTGNINVTVNNSKITKYCGGPKFGNMNLDANNPANNKTVTTNASGTTFGVYYGGGNGGTSYVQYASTDYTNSNASGNFNWGTTGGLNGYTPKQYRDGDGNHNYMADYEMEIVNSSAGTDANKAIFRSYLYAAQFSATNTGPITNKLTDCQVLTSFYGAGNLGGVIGNVTSTLTNTEVLGSAFGAGYSASVPEVTIYNKDKTAPTINVYTGIITPTLEGSGTCTTYTWTNETSLGGQTLSTSNPAVTNVGGVDGNNYFYTEEPLVNLGAVSGAVTLTINGNSNIGHDVFGGGDSSAVINTTNPANASTTVKLQGNAQVQGNVFGGGNRGLVSGTATVNVEQ